MTAVCDSLPIFKEDEELKSWTRAPPAGAIDATKNIARVNLL